MHAAASASLTIRGVDGVLEVIAFLCFLVALIIALLPPRDWWKAGIAGGLLAWLLTLLVR